MGAGEIPLDFVYSPSGKSGELAPERFNSAGEIRDVCNQMLSADRRRSAWRAAIDGLIDGNPTYQLSKLKAKGQGWRARVNYREAEGLMQQRMSPFYDLVTEVNPCIEVCLDYSKGVDNTDMANKIAKHFHWLYLRKWRTSFNFHIPLQQMEMFKHGIGYHIWPGNKNFWTPRTPVTGFVLFPDDVSINLNEDLDYFMLRDFLPGYALYNFIRNEKAAKALGWNPSAVWSALLQSSKARYRSGEATTRFSLEMLQREMKSGDIGTTVSRQAGVWLNHLFVKEIGTGKISQYTIAEGATNSFESPKKTGYEFADCLFRKRNKFDEWPLTIFPYDIGNGGKLHTVRGLGARTKDFFELSNRITNAMADQILMACTLLMKQTGDVDPDKLRLARMSVMSILPKGLEVAQGVKFPDLSQGPIAFRDMIRRTMQGNNEAYMQELPEPADRETAQSFTMRTQNAGQMGKGAHSLYASNYQQALERMFRIASSKNGAMGDSYPAKLAREYQERLVRDNVPLEALEHVYEINEVLSTGAGSPAARLDALFTLWKFIYPTTSEPKKINLERDLTAAVMTSSKVDRYARSLEDSEIPNSDASLAAQENNGFMLPNSQDIVAPEQDHVMHLQIHLPKGQEVAQGAMTGQADPAQSLAILQQAGPHMAKHLQYLQGNVFRKAEYDALYKQWNALSIIADKLQQQVEAAAAAQQNRPSPRQQISDTMQIALAKIDANRQVETEKNNTRTALDLRRIQMDGRLKAIEMARNGAAKKAA